MRKLRLEISSLALIFLLQAFTSVAFAERKSTKKNAPSSILEQLESTEKAIIKDGGTGLTVLGSREKKNTSANDISSQLKVIEKSNAEVRADILALQDQMIGRLNERAKLNIALEVPYPAQKSVVPLGILDLNARLGDIPLVHYRMPQQLSENQNFPIFEGSLPAGIYKLKIRALVGFQQAGWPYALSQGRWVLEKEFTLKANGGEKLNELKIILSRSGASSDPQFAIQSGEMPVEESSGGGEN